MEEQCSCCAGTDNGIGDALSFIAQGGWHITAVMAGTRHDEPPFAYSTGLTSQGLPELVIYGLPQRTAGNIINDVAQRLVDGETIAAGSRLSKVIRDFDVVLIDARDTSALYETRSLYEHFTALQIVFPDKHGVFPWEAAYSLDPWAQPLTGEPPA